MAVSPARSGERRSMALGASAVVDATIAAIAEKEENKMNVEEYCNTGDIIEEAREEKEMINNPDEDTINDDLETKQLSDLSMEELGKHTEQAIEDLDRGRARDLVAEISRRATSPAPYTASAKAINSFLRQKISALEQEIKRLRKEIAKKKDMENKEEDGKVTRSDVEGLQHMRTRGNESSMEWATSALEDGQRYLYKYLEQMIPEVTKRVVSAVDVTLARFVERLVSLEISISRMLENRTIAERDSQIAQEILEGGRRGERRKFCRLFPLLPSLSIKRFKLKGLENKLRRRT